MEVLNRVSRTEIAFYNNYLLDTSGIELFDLGDGFDNYKIESTEQRTYERDS